MGSQCVNMARGAEDVAEMADVVPASNAVPQHLGDIMSHNQTEITFPDEFAPLERIALSANGNLQRIIR